MYFARFGCCRCVGGVLRQSEWFIQTTGFGMQNITAPILEKNEWLLRYKAKDLMAARHRSQFMAVNGTGAGFLVDYAEQRLAFQDLSYRKGRGLYMER